MATAKAVPRQLTLGELAAKDARMRSHIRRLQRAQFFTPPGVPDILATMSRTAILLFTFATTHRSSADPDAKSPVVNDEELAKRFNLDPREIRRGLKEVSDIRSTDPTDMDPDTGKPKMAPVVEVIPCGRGKGYQLRYRPEHLPHLPVRFRKPPCRPRATEDAAAAPPPPEPIPVKLTCPVGIPCPVKEVFEAEDGTLSNLVPVSAIAPAAGQEVGRKCPSSEPPEVGRKCPTSPPADPSTPNSNVLKIQEFVAQQLPEVPEVPSSDFILSSVLPALKTAPLEYLFEVALLPKNREKMAHPTKGSAGYLAVLAKTAERNFRFGKTLNVPQAPTNGNGHSLPPVTPEWEAYLKWCEEEGIDSGYGDSIEKYEAATGKQVFA